MGSWHIPMEEKSGYERGRVWLCIGRAGTCNEHDEVPSTNGVVHKMPPAEASNKAESITGKRKDRD